MRAWRREESEGWTNSSQSPSETQSSRTGSPGRPADEHNLRRRRRRDIEERKWKTTRAMKSTLDYLRLGVGMEGEEASAGKEKGRKKKEKKGEGEKNEC